MKDIIEAIERLNAQVNLQLQSQISMAKAFQTAPIHFEQLTILRDAAQKQARQMEALQASFSNLDLSDTNILQSMRALSESFRRSLELAHKMRRPNWINVLDASKWHHDYSQAAENGWAFYDLPPAKLLDLTLISPIDQWSSILVNNSEIICDHAELLLRDKNFSELKMYENAMRELLQNIRSKNWISVQALSSVFVSSILEEFYLKESPAHRILNERDELYSGIHEIDREVIFLSAKSLWPGKPNEYKGTLNRNKSTHYLVSQQYKPEHAIQFFMTAFALYAFLCNNPNDYRS